MARIRMTDEERSFSEKESKSRYRSSEKGIKTQSDYMEKPGVREASYRNYGKWLSKPGSRETLARAKRACNLRDKYGITLKDYDRMMLSQNCVCAICHGVSEDGKRLAVDHDHVSGKVRGLLCTDCNLTLGLLKENHARILSMANYISTTNLAEA